MKINARLYEEASGGGDQQPPWDPDNPPFWWNPNTPIPPGYPQYPADRDGDGVISINEWLVWAENLMRAWAKENTGEGGRGVPEWVGRGGLPTHLEKNPWLILPVGGPGTGDVDMKTHPLYFLFLYYRENYDQFREEASQTMLLFLLKLINTLMPGNYPLTPSQKMTLAQGLIEPFLVLFFGTSSSFGDFISVLRFFWNPHIPDSILDRIGDIFPGFITNLRALSALLGVDIDELILTLRLIMLEDGGGLGDGILGQILGAAGDGTGGLYSMPGSLDDGVPQFTPEGYLEGGTWFYYNGNWYYLEPVGPYNPDFPPEVIDRPKQPENPVVGPMPDFPQEIPDPPPPLPGATEGEFAKAFARYNKGMNGKGIR